MVVGQWIVGVISIQKIFCLRRLKGYKKDIIVDVTLEDNACIVDCSARILETEFALYCKS